MEHNVDAVMSNVTTSDAPAIEHSDNMSLANGTISGGAQPNGSTSSPPLDSTKASEDTTTVTTSLVTDIVTEAGTVTTADITEATTTIVTESQDDDKVSPEQPTEMDVDQEPAKITEIAEPVEGANPPEAEPMATEESADKQQASLPPLEQASLPNETPKDPPPTPAVPAVDSGAVPITEAPKVEDRDMKDAPPSPVKLSRARDEDDAGDEPATKRTRTDGDAGVSDFKKPELPALDTSTPVKSEPATGETQSSPAGDAKPLTKAQHKFLQSSIRNLKRTKDASFFNVPVDPVKLNIPSYPSVIKNPMDLGTMEANLKHERYQTVEEVIADLHLIVNNTVTFNGPEHLVTKAAFSLQAGFERMLSNLPKADVVEPSSAEKRAKKAAASKAAPARRESRSAAVPPATPAATSAGSPTTFALGPLGTPLIRRDSTVADGRPKREIHPPPPRDLPYATSKPKKKKFVWELKFCQEALNELNKPKYTALAVPFLYPVDPVAYNIPHYHKIVKKPMDLSTIQTKLKNGEYENAKEFEADIKLVFSNCYKFNPVGDPVHRMGRQLEAIFDDKWTQKKDWIDDHVPASAPHSAASSPEPDDDDDESDEDEGEDVSQIDLLQQQIDAMKEHLESMRKNSKKSSPGAKGKKSKQDKNVKKAGKKGGKAADRGSTSKSDKKKKAGKNPRTPYITYEQKQEISNRINTLPANRMQTALKIIRDNMPNLKVIHGLRVPWESITHSSFRESRMTSWSSTSTNSPTRFCTSSSNSCRSTLQERVRSRNPRLPAPRPIKRLVLRPKPRRTSP